MKKVLLTFAVTLSIGSTFSAQAQESELSGLRMRSMDVEVLDVACASGAAANLAQASLRPGNVLPVPQPVFDDIIANDMVGKTTMTQPGQACAIGDTMLVKYKIVGPSF